MGTKNHAHDNDYQTTFVFLSSNQLHSIEYKLYVGAKACFLENISVSVQYHIQFTNVQTCDKTYMK